MPFYIVNGMRVHLNLGRNSKKWPKPCMVVVEREGIQCHCQGISGILCDWPVGDSTCDMPLCDSHATEVGRDRHYCPKHLAEHRAAEPELF